MNNQHPNNTVRPGRTAIIAGAGPAGLTAATELLDRTDISPVVMEASEYIGGISRTARYAGNRMDIGGHRFFSKSRRVTDFWQRFMPVGADPDTTDRVMLRRPRVSRIFYLHRFFDYPISMSGRTFRNLGLKRTLHAGFDFIKARFRALPETSLENFYINRFGRALYHMFFEEYTRKVWGVHPSRLGADWGAQRVKGLSLWGIVKDMVERKLGRKNRKVQTSLIEEFSYPKYGPGQLWEAVAEDIAGRGGQLRMSSEIIKIHVTDGRVEAVTVRRADGTTERVACDILFSSMPVKDLVAALDGVDIPEDLRKAASELPYRDFMTVGLEVDSLAIGDMLPDGSRKLIPDTWIYIQEHDAKIGRLQVFNNWSPYLVRKDINGVWLGLEYFCAEGDEMWTMPDDRFIAMATDELTRMGIIAKGSVRDAVVLRVKKAYPSYFGSYSRMNDLRELLDTIPNLFCIGRNGQHRYNNMDHSMLTAMTAVDQIVAGNPDRGPVWQVNTEEEYHEEKQSGKND